LLNYYAQSANTNDIYLEWKITILDDIIVSEIDLCTLLGHLIENAFYGCMTVA